MMGLKHKLDELEGFDCELGLERLQGNRSLYIKLLRDFSVGYRNFAAKVKGVLATRNQEKAHQLVHTMKGLAGNLSANELHEAARSLDEALKEAEPNWREVEKRYGGFEKALNRAVSSVDELNEEVLDSSNQSGELVASSVALPPEFAGNLRQLIELGDIMAINELVDNPAIEKTFQSRIMELVDDLDFDGIIRLIDQIDTSMDSRQKHLDGR